MIRNFSLLSLGILVSACAVESAPDRGVHAAKTSQSLSVCADDPDSCAGVTGNDWQPYPDLVAGGAVDPVTGQLVVNPYLTQPSDLCIRPDDDRFHLIVRTYNHGNAAASHSSTTVVEFVRADGSISQTASAQMPALDPSQYVDWIVPLPSTPVDFWIHVDSVAIPGSMTGEVLESNESNWFHGNCFY